MNRKLLAILVTLALLGALVYWLPRLLASHETRIRWLLEEMEECFNAGDALGIGGGLADDFTEAESGMDRRQTILVMIQLVKANRDREGRFLYRAEMLLRQGEGIEVADTDSPTATVVVPVKFFRLAPGIEEGAEKQKGTVEFRGDLVIEGGDWKFLRARRKIIEGADPF